MNWTHKKVIEKAKAIFPKDALKVLQLLHTYSEHDKSGRARVQLAILKICNADVKRVKYLLEVARQDYRDIISQAEYPESAQLGLVKVEKLTKSEREALIQRDKDQYFSWLNDNGHHGAAG